MKYLWNSFSSPSINISIGVRWGSALSPILSTPYLFLIFYIFEKRIKNLKIPIFILSFVDNYLFIMQDKFLTVLNSHLFYSYYVMSSLVIKHGKMEVFHFSRSHRLFNSPLLNLTLGCLILHPKEM